MAVAVTWLDYRATDYGRRQRTELPNEREALIFVDGLRERDDAKFESVESGPQPDPAEGPPERHPLTGGLQG